MKKIIDTLFSISGSLGFSLKMSWNASKSIFLFRILVEITQSFVPIIISYTSKIVTNELTYIITGSKNFSEAISTIISVLMFVLVIQILSGAFSTVNAVLSDIHNDLLSNFLTIQQNNKLSKLDISFFDSPKFYNEMLNIKRDSYALQTLSWIAVSIIKSIVQLSTTIIILGTLHWIFPILLVLFSFPTLLMEKKFAKQLYMWFRKNVPEERRMGYLLGILTSRDFVKEMHLFNLFNTLNQKYLSIWNKWFKNKRKIIISKAKWTMFFSILPKIILVVISIYIVFEIAIKKLEIGDFSYYQSIAVQITGGLASLIASLSQLYDNNIKIKYYKEFLTWESILKKSGNLKLPTKPKIEFIDVKFKYPNTEKYILDGVNFKINFGEKVALVGLNGAGKSTIIKLLLRFYDPTSGKILINNNEIHEYSLKEIRKVFSVLFQDYANYSFTLKDNIIISNIENKEKKNLESSIILSGLDNIVNKLDNGINTHLTKQFDVSGEELSGGEWQKVAIARAFFRQGSVIILDEPTATLDPESEYKMFEQISLLCEGKTSFFISHRLSSVTMTDKIIVLENGKIIENGPHKKLLKDNGRYSYLFNLQRKKYLEPKEKKYSFDDTKNQSEIKERLDRLKTSQIELKENDEFLFEKPKSQINSKSIKENLIFIFILLTLAISIITLMPILKEKIVQIILSQL